VCKELITYFISEECVGCQACVRACPADAIKGEKKQQHVIDTELCIKCGTCRTVCKVAAVEVI
jgi:Fe-S-cluster-containing hydrogenase component 2